MKILHLITSLQLGGAERALVNLLGLCTKDKDLHIIAYFHGGPHVESLQDLGYQTYHIKGLCSYADPYGLYQLAQLIKKIKPDIIHSALWSANIIGRCMSRLYKIPIVCDLHGKSSDEGKIRNFFDRMTYSWAQAIIAVSTSTQKNYETTICKNRQYQQSPHITTINNGIDMANILQASKKHPLQRQDIGCKQEDIIIGAVGRLEPIKCYNLLLDAFAHCSEPHIKLVLVGGGSQQQKLHEQALNLGISHNVIFTGAQKNPYSYYPLFDCFALSSHSEGLSIALLEALCFGLPIITTNSSAHHDVIHQPAHGFIVTKHTPSDYAHALKQLIIQLQKNKKHYHEATTALVQKKFTLHQTKKDYMKTYKDILNNFNKK